MRLAAELEKQPWDPSVKSIVNFPDVLNMMSDQLDLTVRVGDRFHRAAGGCDEYRTKFCVPKAQKAAGNLPSNDQQKIIVEAAPAPAHWRRRW